MKINIRFIAVVLIAFALTLVGCETTGDLEEPVSLFGKLCSSAVLRKANIA